MSPGVIRQPELQMSSERDDEFIFFSRHSAKPMLCAVD